MPRYDCDERQEICRERFEGAPARFEWKICDGLEVVATVW